MAQLSPRDRALLHLYDSRGHLSADRPLDALTQEGIATALDVNRTHITRVLRPLLEAGMVETNKGHVAGKGRKLTYYTLTDSGLARAKEILDGAGDLEIDVIEKGQSHRAKVRSLLKERPELRILEVVDNAGGALRIGGPEVRHIDADAPLEAGEFYGREEQMEEAKEFAHSGARLLAIFANYGYGSSTFMKRAALNLFEMPLFWHDLERDGAAEGLLARMTAFCIAEGGDGSLEDLFAREVLICIDNYHGVPEGTVDLLIDLMARLKQGRAKMMVALREDTPSYDRFYQRQDVVSKAVEEVHLSRFDEATSRLMIGEDIDDEAFQLIYMLTRGQPLALALTKRGDERGLRQIRLSEEVRFLMYLRTRRSSK